MSMRLPAGYPSGNNPVPPKGNNRFEKIEYKKISDILGLKPNKENFKFSLCYNCSEMFILDVIINTLLCPKCPSQLPMMNFENYEEAKREARRAMEMNRKRS